MKLKGAVSYEKDLKARLKKDLEHAIGYLQATYEDPDRSVFLLALKDVIEARAGITKAARMAGLNRRHLYVMLSQNGNPEWFSINKILKAIGIRLAFQPKSHSPEQKAA